MLSHREGKPPELSLARGGPFYEWAQRHKLVRTDARGRLHVVRLQLGCVLVAWVPLLLVAAADLLVTGRSPELLRDLSVHARLLIALPSYLFADRMLDEKCRSCVQRLYQDGLLASPDRFTRAIERVHRLRDSRLMELLFLLGALAIGQATLRYGTAGLIDRNPGHLPPSAVRVLYACVAQPLTNFLLLRGLWRWGLWVGLLAAIARADLNLVPLHPDRCAGLKFLERPAEGFVWIAFGLSAIDAGTWSTRILLLGASARSFQNPFLFQITLSLLLAFAPLLLLTGRLVKVRGQGLEQHDRTGTILARMFAQRWFDPARAPGLIDAADSSAMIDYSSTYATLDKLRLMPIGLRVVAAYILIVALPAAAVAVATAPVRQMIGRLVVRVVLGDLL
jgi:hypothetical protein